MKPYIILVILLICVGCQPSEKPQKPDRLISKDKMVDILYDILVLNSTKGINKSVIEINGIKPENYIYEKYNIDSLQFALSNEYYGYHIEDYESIINRLEKRLNSDKALFEKQAEEEDRYQLRKRDSIRNLSDSLNAKKIKNKQK